VFNQVTVSGKTMHLEDPFIVYATQNPIEHEGTYPLPEAQLDRFFFNLLIDYGYFTGTGNSSENNRQGQRIRPCPAESAGNN